MEMLSRDEMASSLNQRHAPRFRPRPSPSSAGSFNHPTVMAASLVRDGVGTLLIRFIMACVSFSIW